jgi:quercetin dioxygenase-like cupin family protein
MNLHQGLITLALLAAPSAAGAAAVDVLLQRDLPNAPGLQMTLERVTFAPGEASGPHHHAGVLSAVVLQGAVVSQVEGEPLHTFRAGESWWEGEHAHHVVARNASRTEPAVFLVTFVAPKGAALSTADARR